MFKLVKFVFFMTLIIVGLYFFGDFRINDTNVRDFLQRTLRVERVRAVRNAASRVFRGLAGLFDAAEKTAGRRSDKPVSGSRPSRYKQIDQLTRKDRRQLKKLIEENVDP